MHVSPFFPTDGEYILSYKKRKDTFSLIVRYFRNNKPALTATMRGNFSQLSSIEILKHIIVNRQFPLRPLISIHFEALKLFLKNAFIIQDQHPHQSELANHKLESPINDNRAMEVL